MRRDGQITRIANVRKGLSLTELLVALLISLIFMGSTVTAFVQISRAADHAEAQIRAHTRARLAIDTIARDLIEVRADPTLSDQFFILNSSAYSYGDNIDNDDDGSTDEEILDGWDDDGDWDLPFDRHIEIVPGEYERADYVNFPDLGDGNVDEDNRFSNDQISFRIPADPGMGDPARIVTYELGSFDGMDHVLLKTETVDPGSVNETQTIEPIVFDVVSLDILAWSANNDIVSPRDPSKRPYYVSDFSSLNLQFPDQRPIGAPFGVPPFEFPAAVLIQVTVSAESVPLSEVGGWPLGDRPLRTQTLSSVVTLESVTKDVRYQIYVRGR